MPGMKGSTIKTVFRNKIQDWLSTIDDQQLKDRIKKDVMISGGAIASMLLGEKVNDYDMYFKTFDTALAVTKYYVEKFNQINGQLDSGVKKSCNPSIKVEDRINIKNEAEKRIIIFMQSSGIASETQSEYHYFESQSEAATEEFMSSLKSNEEDLVEVVEELHTIAKDKKDKYRPIFLSENAITLSNKIQLVVRFYGNKDEIHNNYDFIHTMCNYDYYEDSLTLHPAAMESLLTKSLVYGGSLYPIASLFRIRKFIERGWRITAGQMLKIIWQLQDVNLKDKAVLREQLLGVDQAYMHQLLRALETTTDKVDATYIAKLIDTIFE